ncbi:MAG: aminotransferase class I/II-fold pyridoxal phosphate-dependent enzyme [Clostridia bacterium]|nr:aminotransferase class I/II-fold pyridoxal phosphate-dependent enzyme [Clostridia bacterium]
MYSELSESQLLVLKEKLQAEYDAYKEKKLKLNIARGKPSSEQIDMAMGILDALDSSYEGFITADGDYRNYGMWDGIPEGRKLVAQLLDVPVSNVFIGNNSSLNLMFDVISCAYTHGLCGNKPWCKEEKLKFLCPAPGYDRHFAMTEYFGFELITVPMLETGPDMDVVEKLVAEDPAIKGIWCVPKYSNPTGITYSDETVRRFAALKPAAPDFRIMWDNAYCVHDLTDTPDVLLNLYAECEKNGTEDLVFMFTSTSKISFPGGGISALAASDANMKTMHKYFSVMTIGPDKLNQLRHVLYFKDINGVNAMMKKLRTILAPKFELCDRKLHHHLDNLCIAHWNKPNGGYFISLNVMEGCAKRVFNLCKEAGVVLTDAGATYPYGMDPKDSNIRLAPTYSSLEELDTAMDLLCVCVKMAAAEKCLANLNQ